MAVGSVCDARMCTLKVHAWCAHGPAATGKVLTVTAAAFSLCSVDYIALSCLVRSPPQPGGNATVSECCRLPPAAGGRPRHKPPQQPCDSAAWQRAQTAPGGCSAVWTRRCAPCGTTAGRNSASSGGRFWISACVCHRATHEGMSQSPACPLQAIQPALANASNHHVSHSDEAGSKSPAHIAHEEPVQV